MNGLWTAEFGSSTGRFGGGVIVFQNGKLMGGDASYFYLGDYTSEGDSFTAAFTISPFLPNAESVFNAAGRAFTLRLAGSVTGGVHAVAQGQAEGAPDIRFGVKLTKRA